MNVLVINAGSSSLKYQLFDMDTEQVIAKGNCERIGLRGGFIKYTPVSKGIDTLKEEIDMPTHSEAINAVLQKLASEDFGVVASLEEISAIGHRVLHGGHLFSESVLLTDDVVKAVEEIIPLGPLHIPANLMGLRACQNAMPGTPQVAVFDTAFHQTMPNHAFTYALPYDYYETHHVRRYGFHGTSHGYVSKEAISLLGEENSSRLITCHCGNGSSVAAIKDGKCLDTSMGLTPLEGLPMGTRCGNIDPAIIDFIATQEGKSHKEIFHILNNESGLLGVSGLSSDSRDVEEAAENGHERSQLALDIFRYSLSKTIASYYVPLGGLDALVFTAGLGENSPVMREAVIDQLACFGLKIDLEANKVRGGKFGDITGEGSTARILVIPTNEELVIARDTKEIVGV